MGIVDSLHGLKAAPIVKIKHPEDAHIDEFDDESDSPNKPIELLEMQPIESNRE